MGYEANANVPENARHIVMSVGGRNVVVMDSVSFATPDDAGHVIVTGSHGGASAGEYAARIAPLVAVCSDAGIGKNAAGVAGLKNLDRAGTIGLAVSYLSARIGDGADAWTNGIISFVNEMGKAAGFSVGAPLCEAVAQFLQQSDARHVSNGKE